MNKEKHFTSIIRVPLLAIISILLLQHHVSGAGVVSVCDDANLRAAVTGGGLVTFTCGGTIVLTNEIVIANDTIVDATGQSNTISGGNLTRLFKVNPGIRLDLLKLTLANGLVDGGQFAPEAVGGAILNDGGTVVLNDCRLLNNLTIGSTNQTVPGTAGNGFGGGIWSSNGIVRATNTLFAANKASGGIGHGTLTGLPSTLASGKGSGGALYQFGGETVLVKCQFQSNSAFAPGPLWVFLQSIASGPAFGGAIWHSNGILTMAECEFSSNAARLEFTTRFAASLGAFGGAIFSGSSLSASNCVFVQNIADPGFGGGTPGPHGHGGALFLAGPAVISSSTIKSNSAIGGPASNSGGGPLPGGAAEGGGIFSLSTLTLINSTLAFNEVSGGPGSMVSGAEISVGRGGAIYNSGTVLATNVTVFGNRTTGGTANPGQNAHGGGFYNSGGGVVQISYSTIASNAAIGGLGNFPGNGIGGAFDNSSGTVALQGSIVTGNEPGNASGTITDNGYNISSDATCAFIAAGSLNNTDPVVSLLADFGGPTLTSALLAGSPAMNAGNPASFPPTDQRGRARPFGPTPDIGAFESSAPYSILGTITGPATQQPMIVIAGNTNAPLINGSYAIHDEPAGTYPVLPYNHNYLFVPDVQVATVGPDKVGVNFKSYNWYAFTLEEITNNVMHLVFATTNSPVVYNPSFRVFTSIDLHQWSIVSTNYVGSSNYNDLYIPIGNEPARFFRALVP